MADLTIKQENFYVYALIDPRDNSIFYIGKGSKNRMHQHVIDAKSLRITNVGKHAKIQSIIDEGLDVNEVVIRHFEYECDAYIYERHLLIHYKSIGLTNIANGFSGISTQEEKAHYLLLKMNQRIKPFDIWIKEAKKEVIDYAIKNYGSAFEYHLDFVNSCNRLLELTKPKVMLK